MLQLFAQESTTSSYAAINISIPGGPVNTVEVLRGDIRLTTPVYTDMKIISVGDL